MPAFFLAYLLRRRTSGDVSRNTNLSRSEIDQLADKLIERREKFEYFLITAFAAVIVFTFNDFNNPGGVLRLAPLWLTALGWLLLILASVLPLYSIGLRHKVYSRYLSSLQARLEGKPRPLEGDGPTTKEQQLIARGRSFMVALFVLGITVLAISYVVGLINAHNG